MIVVLDATVWISAIHFAGTPRKVVELVTQAHTLAISDRISQEVIRTITGKFCYTLAEAQELWVGLTSEAIRVTISGAVQGVCRDPNDDHVLECAQFARADLLVSGDRDLLVLRSFRRTRIINSREFLENQW